MDVPITLALCRSYRRYAQVAAAHRDVGAPVVVDAEHDHRGRSA
jgi:hypothetical protein